MTKKRDVFNIELSLEEQEIEAALPEQIEKLVITKNLAREQDIAKKTAHNSLRKDTKINIRLATQDVEKLRRLASREGLPYQTLIASVLHKYAVSSLA